MLCSQAIHREIKVVSLSIAIKKIWGFFLTVAPMQISFNVIVGLPCGCLLDKQDFAGNE
jgi:hypothetical protein